MSAEKMDAGNRGEAIMIMKNEGQDNAVIAINDNEGFYFDRLHINSVLGIDELRCILPIDCLKEESKYFFLRPSILQKHGFKTLIDVTAPTKKCIEAMSVISNTRHSVTYIEIARDIFYSSKHLAGQASYDLFRTVRKKNSRGFLFRADKAKKISTKIRENNRRRGLFAEQTFYSGFENKESRKIWFKLVVYARFSKINQLPCVHYEWRIKKASLIKERTGIKTIRDILHFDAKAFFKKTADKYILHEKLNTEKIGRVLSGHERKRKITECQKMSIDLHFSHFRSCYDIATVSDFATAVIKIKRLLDRIPGPKTAWAKKIKKLNHFSTFALPIRGYTP